MNLSDICVIVILYNPNKTQIEVFERLNKGVDVIAVDNSDGRKHVKCKFYLPMMKNLGIANAQNCGLEIAFSKNYKYVLFLDQDSKMELESIYLLKKDYQFLASTCPNVAAIGPTVIDEKTNLEYKSESTNSCYSEVSSIISSGMFVELDKMKIIGPMEGELFIDYVDCEWCWRALSKGYSIFMTRKVILHHSVGSEYFKLLGIPFCISSPIRYYYQYRNLLRMCKRSYVPTSWKVKSLIRSFAELFIIPMTSKNGCLILKNMIKGVKDGCL